MELAVLTVLCLQNIETRFQEAGMKNLEFYRKFKTNDHCSEKGLGEPWWQMALTGLATLLIEPLVVYKKFRSIPFTRDFYFQQIKYFLLIGFPFVLYYFWTTWRGSIKRHRAFYWVGKFEVIRKRRAFTLCYLTLTPGNENKIKVSRSLFTKIREGDFVIIRRDSLGKVEKVTQVKDFAARLNRVLRYQSKGVECNV